MVPEATLIARVRSKGTEGHGNADARRDRDSHRHTALALQEPAVTPDRQIYPAISELLQSSGLLAQPAFVASTGGHLEQAFRISSSFPAAPTWITFHSPQSDSMLPAEHTTYVHEVRQRDVLGAVRAFPAIFRALRTRRPSCLASTGAAVALPAFIAAKLLRIPTIYIESNSRIAGPSVTGRVVARSRLASLCLSPHDWSTGRWHRVRSILDDFEAVEDRHPDGLEHSLFVTIGTVKKYPLRSIVDALVADGLADDSTVWQLAETDPTGAPGTVHQYVSSQEFDRIAQDSKVVVSHAGMGSILRLLELGTFPILVVRRASRGEHVDDHQEQIARVMQDRGLALVVEVDELRKEHLTRAAGFRIRRTNA